MQFQNLCAKNEHINFINIMITNNTNFQHKLFKISYINCI